MKQLTYKISLNTSGCLRGKKHASIPKQYMSGRPATQVKYTEPAWKLLAGSK